MGCPIEQDLTCWRYGYPRFCLEMKSNTGRIYLTVHSDINNNIHNNVKR